MRTVLPFCLVSSLLLLLSPPVGGERRAQGRTNDKNRPRTDRPSHTPPAPTGPQNSEQADERTNEQAPDPRPPIEIRRADLVEMRYVGRSLAAIARQARDPLQLAAAAQLLQRLPPARPLVQARKDEGDAQPPPRRAAASPVLDNPDPKVLLAEARALAQSKDGPVQRETLALLDRLAQVEVVPRGAALGPQQVCEGLSPNVKLIYNIAYDGGEKAVVAISGNGPGELNISVTDLDGGLVARTRDRTLIAWYPRWRAVYRVELENRTPQRIEFCMETN